MKFLDSLLGRTKLRKPKVDALFSLSTAYLAMEVMGFAPAGKSGICFKPVESSRFSELENDLKELLRLSASESGTACQFQTDEYNYAWIILSDDDFEDLITTTHLISETVIEHDFEERLLCSIFAFKGVYLIYSYKEGTFYPFAPKWKETTTSNLEYDQRWRMNFPSKKSWKSGILSGEFRFRNLLDAVWRKTVHARISCGF
jgi:hypothetical protein